MNSEVPWTTNSRLRAPGVEWKYLLGGCSPRERRTALFSDAPTFVTERQGLRTDFRHGGSLPCLLGVIFDRSTARSATSQQPQKADGVAAPPKISACATSRPEHLQQRA